MPEVSREALLRRQIGDRLKAIEELSDVDRPPGGWVRAIREALGLSLAQLGTRLPMTASGVQQLERSERAGTITLRSLNALADAMECDVVYALVPRRPLDELASADRHSRPAGALALDSAPGDPSRLSEAEIRDLVPTHIATRSELAAWEEANALDGERWALASRARAICSLSFMRRLHREMFDGTWRSAGDLRSASVTAELTRLCGDLSNWPDRSIADTDDIALRFHHRLVAIQPFVRANGPFARLLTDMLLTRLGRPRFAWGSADPSRAADVRTRYASALRAADRGDYGPLKTFVRS